MHPSAQALIKTHIPSFYTITTSHGPKRGFWVYFERTAMFLEHRILQETMALGLFREKRDVPRTSYTTRNDGSGFISREARCSRNIVYKKRCVYPMLLRFGIHVLRSFRHMAVVPYVPKIRQLLFLTTALVEKHPVLMAARSYLIP
jgi:hypothetical protein